VGRSSFDREPDGAFVVRIDDAEVHARTPLRGPPMRGVIRLLPLERPIARGEVLAPGHLWSCPAPRCAVSARFDAPDFALDGLGYHDVNRGHEPPLRAFASWSWGRYHAPTGTRIE